MDQPDRRTKNTFEQDEQRIRARAHLLWEEQGRPDGQEDANLELARELVAIEDNQAMTTEPVPRDPDDPGLAAEEEGEPAGPAANALGEIPTLTDEGEQTYPPSREAEQAARDEHPPDLPKER
jgi:hypothetical protein